MKKLLVVLLTLALCVTALTSCDAVNKVKDGFLNLIGKGPKDETPAVTYNAEAAADYIFNLYQSKSITAADFEVTAKVALFDDASAQTVSYDVTWAVDTDKVTITKKDDNTYIVNVDEESKEEVAYVLTATVTAADGTKATKSFNLTVPKYVLWSHEEYMAAKEGDNVVVKGIVVAITSESMNNKYNHLFLADLEGKGGYYCYDLEKDPVADLGIEVGMIVEVAAPVTPYSGMQETKGGSARIIDSNKHEVAPVDLSAKLAAGESLANYVGMPVIFKNVEIKGQVLGGTSEYLNFELNGKTAYVRTYVSDFPISFGDVTREGDVFSSPSKAVIDEAHATHRGWRADATGILVLYNSNPYLIPMGTDCFTYYELIVKTDAQKAQEALDELDIPTSISKNTVIDLAATSTLYSEVTFAWASDNENFAIADNKVNITLGAAAATLKLTATATCGEATATKDFVIEISASVVLSTTKPYIPSLFQAKLDGGKTLYLDGTFGERYLNTTDDATKAVAIYAEAAEGGYKFYILVDGAKNYLYLYKNDAGKDAVKYDAANANVFSYNETVNAWVTDYNNDQYYLGTYNTFNTVSCSKLSYINADNTGKDQFPLEYTPVVENVALNGTLFQAKLDGGKTLYLDGTFGERYLNTTDDITKAVAIYAEKAEDGYKFYILVNDVKNYIYLYKNDAGKSAVKFDAENANVFKFDGATNAWATVYDGGDYYLGTYNTYNTVSSSKTSYIDATNTGVEQFPLNYIIANAATPETPETPENPENPETPETPDTPANPETPETPDLSTTKGIYEAASKLADNVALNDQTYTMTGVVAVVNEAYNSEYSNVTVTITVDGYNFKCFRMKGDGASVIAAGDTITVSGTITAYGGAPQFAKDCTLVSYEKAPEVELPANAFIISFADKTARTEYSTEKQVWVQNGITITNEKASSTSNVGDYAGPARFYKTSNVTIACAGMTKIEINCVGIESKYVEPWMSVSAGTATNNNGIITIVFEAPVDALVYTALTAQARANNITVYTA